MGNRNFIIRWVFNRANKKVIISNSWKSNLDKIRIKISCIFFLTVMVLSHYNNVPKTSIVPSSMNLSIKLHF